MKCIHYEVYSKKTGKLVFRDFGWFDNSTDVYKLLAKEYSKCNVVICK